MLVALDSCAAGLAIPGSKTLDSFEDVRELKKKFKDQGLAIENETEEAATGPLEGFQVVSMPMFGDQWALGFASSNNQIRSSLAVNKPNASCRPSKTPTS